MPLLRRDLAPVKDLMYASRRQAGLNGYRSDCLSGFMGRADRFVALLRRKSRLAGGSADFGQRLPHHARKTCG